MAYGDFAFYYDALNTEANYDLIEQQLLERLLRYGVPDGIVADLGCGTGELTLRLALAGYDMLAVDASASMLSILQQKLYDGYNGPAIQLLQQKLENLDLYGTIKAAVSTFDTLNHIERDAVAEAIRRIALFLEPDGLFIFDVNTPYKHQNVLGDQTFLIEAEDGLVCQWTNKYEEVKKRTSIQLCITQHGKVVCKEHFYEHVYTPQFWEDVLISNRLEILEKSDGENFGELMPNSERILFVARKRAD